MELWICGIVDLYSVCVVCLYIDGVVELLAYDCVDLGSCGVVVLWCCVFVELLSW